MVLLLAPGTGESAAVAGKRVGGAVERNRARRILRAASASSDPPLEAHDVVAVASPDHPWVAGRTTWWPR